MQILFVPFFVLCFFRIKKEMAGGKSRGCEFNEKETPFF